MRVVAFCLMILSCAGFARAMDIQEVVSDGGVTIWLVEEPSIPIVSVELQFAGGGTLDPDDKLGATTLMTGLLEEGAGDLDTLAFAKAVEDLAVRFSFSSNSDGVSVGATMLSENREASLDLLALALNEPRFDDTAMERVRAQLLASLRSDANNPDMIARERFRALAFAGHPYSRPAEGTSETVSALTVDDMRAAHARALVRSRVTVSVVGDITADEVGPMIDGLLAGLPEEGPARPGSVIAADTGEDIVVDFRTPQSVAVFGHSGLDREDPDFAAAFVVNTIVGGSGFDSRLGQEIRERRGLTYGIYTYLAPSDLGALYLGSVASANDRMAEVVRLVEEEWARVSEEGVTEMELDDAKRYLTGAYPLRFTSNARIADALVGMQLANLPLDYVDTRNDLINSLTREEVNRVAKELFKPEALSIVVVGQPIGLARTE